MPNGLSLILATNSTCIKKENYYWLLIFYHNVGDSVQEGTVSEPKCHFKQWHDKIL